MAQVLPPQVSVHHGIHGPAHRQYENGFVCSVDSRWPRVASKNTWPVACAQKYPGGVTGQFHSGGLMTSLLSKGASGASWLIALTAWQRLLTFAMNQLLVRASTPGASCVFVCNSRLLPRHRLLRRRCWLRHVEDGSYFIHCVVYFARIIPISGLALCI
jgi:hypothetical protein